MSEKKYVVPEGMMNAGRAKYNAYLTAEEGARVILEAAIRWLAENPIVPTDEQSKEIVDLMPDLTQAITSAWQRRMFLASEPEPLSDDARLFINTLVDGKPSGLLGYSEFRQIAEDAYRYGRNSREDKGGK